MESCIERFSGDLCDIIPTCRPLPCSSDSECEEYMKCQQEAGPTTPGLCLPGWHLECGTDADCGAGFTCAPWEPCLDPSERADASGTCEPYGERVCYIHTRACQGDSDCWAGWTCENNPQNAFISDANGQEWCGISEPALICVPPHGRQFGLGAGYLDWQTGVEWASRTVPVSECPSSRSRNADYTVNGGGVDETVPTDTGTDPAVFSPAAPAASTSAAAAAFPMTSAASRGCSLPLSNDHNAASPPWTLLGVGALAALVRRARRKRA